MFMMVNSAYILIRKTLMNKVKNRVYKFLNRLQKLAKTVG